MNPTLLMKKLRVLVAADSREVRHKLAIEPVAFVRHLLIPGRRGAEKVGRFLTFAPPIGTHPAIEVFEGVKIVIRQDNVA